MITRVFFLACVVALSVLCDDDPLEGAFEVINPNGSNELSYIANLVLDRTAMGLNQTIYFTADRGSSNVYTATFEIGGGPGTFTSSGVSLFGQIVVFPYLSMDVSQTNVIGPVFNLPPIGVQNVLVSDLVVSSNSSYTNQYSFFSTLIHPRIGPGDTFVYLVGWADVDLNAFVVARSVVYIGSSDALKPILTMDDIIRVQTGSSCYDQYDETNHPKIFLFDNFLHVLSTGKCAYFITIKIPPLGSLWSLAEVKLYDPTLGVKYVSSATMDTNTGLVFYTTKEFNLPYAVLYSFNTNSLAYNSSTFLTNLDDLERDSELLLSFGISSPYLFIVASGSNKILRYTVASGAVSQKNLALLPEDLKAVSSVLFYSPYLYLCTYEPDAKIARIHTENDFCTFWCSDGNGYCSNRQCKCYAGYTTDATLGCAPVKEVPMVPATAELGLTIAIVIIAIVGLVGWVLWYKRRRTYTAIA